MKYIFLPILRVLYIILCYLGAMPIAYVLAFMGWIWTLDTAYFKEVTRIFFKDDFHTEDLGYISYEEIFIGYRYYVYKNPWDFLINKKSWRTTTHESIAKR